MPNAKQNNSDKGNSLAEILAANAAIAAKAPAPSKGGGQRKQGNTLQPVPAGCTAPIDSAPDFQLKGVSGDGIFVYLQTYSTGSKWEKKVTADGKRFDSWAAARKHWAALRKQVG